MSRFSCSCWLILTCLSVGGPAAAQVAVEDPCEAGRQLFVANNYLGAEPLLVQCLESGDSLLALLPLTMITTIQGRAGEGVAYGARALAIAPDNANVRYWYGRALLINGDPDGAMAQWEQGLAEDIQHAGILEGLIQLHLQRGDTAKAYNLLHQLRLQGVDEPWLHKTLSDLARRKGLWGQAATHWADMIRVEGETEDNLVVLGELTILAGKPADAVDIFRHAVATLPSGATWGGLGEAWFALDEVDSAAVALEHAVGLDPDNPRNRFNLANALEILGQYEAAGEQFSVYLEQSPDDPTGHFNYGVHLEKEGRRDAALAEIERAVALDPSYLQAQVVLAQMYEAAGRAEDALAVVERLESMDPEASAELEQWRIRLRGDSAEAAAALSEGKVHLLHIVTDDPAAADQVRTALEAGADFAALAARFSIGPTAVRGGDIGWVDPADMMGPLQAAINALAPGQTSPAIDAEGRLHFFRRVR